MKEKKRSHGKWMKIQKNKGKKMLSLSVASAAS